MAAKKARSALELALDDALKQLYPQESPIHDMAIKVRGKTLYVDRVLRGAKIAVEADGIQHGEFSAHFHRDAAGFASSKERDRLKEQWLADNDYILVRFAHDELITPALLRTRILKAYSNG